MDDRIKCIKSIEAVDERLVREPSIVIEKDSVRVIRSPRVIQIEVRGVDAMGRQKWDDVSDHIGYAKAALSLLVDEVTTLRLPVEMILYCPRCGLQHVDAPDSDLGPHRSHLCANPDCRCTWRPADVATRGVREIRTQGEGDCWRPGRPPGSGRF